MSVALGPRSAEGDENEDGDGPRTFVVECSILGMLLLIPFPLSVNVDGIASKAYAEFKKMNPRAPPLKVTCVKDKAGKILSEELTLEDHHLDRHFVVQVEEFSPIDLLQSPEGVTTEYRKWQLWTVHQIFDMIKASLQEKSDKDAASVALKVDDIRNSTDGHFVQQFDDVDKEWAPVMNKLEQDVDQQWITLLDELSHSPDERVKCACLEAFNLLRLRSSSVDVVKGASLRICQMIVDEQGQLDIILCALNCFRVNAKGLLPLSSYHQKEIVLLRSSVVKDYMDILSRFPSEEDQRLIMASYKSMYIHRYGMDTGIGHIMHGLHPAPEHRDGSALQGQEAAHVFGASDLANAEETVARLRTLLDSKEESVWKFAVTKLHTLLNEIRNPLDHTSCFDASVESKLNALFQSSQEVRYLTACLLGCLKSSIDTRSKHKPKRGLLGGDGSGKGHRGKGGKAGKAKVLIDSALLSPETDIPMVKKIIDCLYLMSLPFSFDVGVTDNTESTRLNAIQVSLAKACLENERWRLLLTLCSAQNLAIAGRCAFIFRTLVLVQGHENTEGNHWEQFQPIIDPSAFVALLHNDATNAADYKAVQYSDHLNSTGFGTNQSSDIDSVEVLEAHLGLLVLDYASHLLNARHEAPAGAKKDRIEDPSSAVDNDHDESPVETARGQKGIAAFEQILAKTDALADQNRRGLPSKLSEVEVGEESGVEYVSKLGPKSSTSADKYVLEDVFMEDSNKLFLKLWRMANYTEMPSLETQGRPRDSLRIATCYQGRRLSLDIISQLVAMDSSFKDQLNRLAGAAKLIALMADKSIMRVNLDDYGGGPPVSPRYDEKGEIVDAEESEKESDDNSKHEGKNSNEEGKVDTNNVVSRQVDVEAVRYALKILVTLIVSQDFARQKTIVRLISDTRIGNQDGTRLEHVAQVDRQSAFFYATILTLGNRFD